jgi:hypothetical protein
VKHFNHLALAVLLASIPASSAFALDAVPNRDAVQHDQGSTLEWGTAQTEISDVHTFSVTSTLPTFDVPIDPAASQAVPQAADAG